MEKHLFLIRKPSGGHQGELMVGKRERRPKSGRIVRPIPRNNKFSCQSVLKMLSIMEGTHKRDNDTGLSSTATSVPPTGENPPTNHGVQEFLSSGRTGRRNALPDILGQHALITSSDLPTRLASLSTTDSSQSTTEPATTPGSSKS